MSHAELLHFVALDDNSLRDGDCLRIKLGSGNAGGAVLAFASEEVALYFAAFHKLNPKLLSREELAADVPGSLPLVVFRTIEEIEVAYRDAKTYDFTKHVVPWPAERQNAT
jgi:hypothetical protein